ncbi:hypothetical protein MHYP_G00019930 [Metynnis hypsauchen]
MSKYALTELPQAPVFLPLLVIQPSEFTEIPPHPAIRLRAQLLSQLLISPPLNAIIEGHQIVTEPFHFIQIPGQSANLISAQDLSQTLCHVEPPLEFIVDGNHTATALYDLYYPHQSLRSSEQDQPHRICLLEVAMLVAGLPVMPIPEIAELSEAWKFRQLNPDMEL